MGNKLDINGCVDKWLEDTSQKLYIRDLKMKEWPDRLSGKEHLIIELDCSHNELTSLPNGLINLKKLYCNNNKLTSLPNDLTKLQSLNCSYNELTSLPNSLTKLTWLLCIFNQLKSLPVGLTNLKFLWCCDNKLTSIPEDLINLETLDCSNNKLTDLPNLASLRNFYCHLNSNQLFSNKLYDWKVVWAKAIHQQNLEKLDEN